MKASLKEIHTKKTGKVSDKWDIYLEIYEELLEPFREKAIRLLEIGVQNGGSLETWGYFFKNADILVGCDIDSRCSELRFEDNRVNIVVGDATSQDAANQILDLSKTFDLIIEDGSHRSDDIIKTFVEYFPKLTPGGIYIAEDLHCCYWKEMGGGLSYPYSGMEYFKALCDCLNSNYWNREDATPVAFMNKIGETCGAKVDDDLLDSILSVQFYDSICVIKKASKGKLTRINKRIFGGSQELVTSGLMQHSSDIFLCKQNKDTLKGLVDYADQVRMLSEENTRLMAECFSLQSRVMEILSSNSWRVTKPLRSSKDALKSMYAKISASIKKYKQ